MKPLLLTLLLTASTPVRVTVTLPADFPARIQTAMRQTSDRSITTEEFVRLATEAELTGLEGTLHIKRGRD